MLTIKGVELTEEQFMRGIECNTAEEMMKLCKEGGIDVTKEEAQKYVDNLADIDLTPEQMKEIAGGWREATAGLIKVLKQCGVKID